MADQPTTPDSSSRPDSREPNWERAALERIALAAVKEQRAARRWKIFFRFAFLGVFALLAFALIDFSGDSKFSSGRHTALVTIDGEIAAGTNANAEDINTALDAAFDDDGTAGVVLRINSPGGSPVQAGMVYDEIRRLRKTYPDKPLYVVVTDICASGGYYIASAADKIFVDKASIVGSIGVLMDGFGFTGLMSKLGVERRLHTSGENKGFYDPFSPETPKMDAHAQALLDQVHAQFIKAVKDGRGKRLHETPDMFSGLFLDRREERRTRPRRRLRHDRHGRARRAEGAGSGRLHGEGKHHEPRRPQVRRGGRRGGDEGARRGRHVVQPALNGGTRRAASAAQRPSRPSRPPSGGARHVRRQFASSRKIAGRLCRFGAAAFFQSAAVRLAIVSVSSVRSAATQIWVDGAQVATSVSSIAWLR